MDTSIDDTPDTPGTQRANRDSSLGRSNKNDPGTAFLRAARMGNLDKVLEFLGAGVEINTSNPSGLTALHLASKEGHMPVVAALLQRGADVNAVTGKGNTPLHIAALAGQEEVVRLLLHCDADVNARSQQGFTPLYMAAQENHVDLCKILLSNGAKSSITTDDGFSPLAVALQQGHEKIVSLLLEQENRGKVKLPPLHIAAKKDDVNSARLLLQNTGSEDSSTKISYIVNEPTKTGFTPLHIAAHYGNHNVGAVLIEKGADVDFKGRNSITPLHVSSKWGRPTMVKLLLDNHAAIEARTRDGLTALHCAARSGHTAVVDLLLQRGANSTCKTKNGLSPLHMSVQGNHEEVSRLLIQYKSPIDDVTVDSLTPLHVAAHCGNVETAKVLLENKCTVDSRALNGFTPLHIACKKFRIRIIELLLKFGANIEATTESGLTPLHVAAYMGHNQVIVFLIQHGADPNAQTVRGETPLHLATRGNQVESMGILLRNGAQVDAKANEQQTSLHIAARLGNVDAVKLLLSNGANVNAITKDNYTPLHIAAKEGYVDVVIALLDGGADTTVLTQNGLSPLHIAAKYGQTGVIKALLDRGADANIKGKNGLTPLHVAAHYNQPAAVDMLLKYKADPHKTAKNGYTPLHIAAKKNLIEVATTLLEQGAKPNVGSKSGFTPLHLAAQEGHKEMVALLLKYKADVNSNAKNGLTPMHLAAQEDHVPVAEVLVEYKAQIDPETKAGYTPLHTASHFAKINMINFLLRHGANVNAKTKLNYTPLHMGAQQGHVLVVKVLLQYKANPDELTSSGQTPLSIAQQLGYVSVVEVLKSVTTVTATATDEKYKIVSPETFQETMDGDEDERPISGDFEDADDAADAEHNKSYLHLRNEDVQYLHEEDMSPTKFDERDLNFSERMSASGSLSPSMYLDRSSQHQQDDEIVFSDVVADVQQAAPMYASVPSLGSNSWLSDNLTFERQPIHSGFLVSFMVDARGGAMRGCRHSGIRFIIPPCTATMPTRITCKMVRQEKLAHPPPLMDGEALAARVLEMGPPGAKFQGSIIIEVPHYASLRGKEREVQLLRSDNGEHWYEHPLVATEDVVQQTISMSFEDLETAEELYNRRIARILTNDFPRYFAIVTRIRQDVGSIGAEGGIISSTVVPQVQAIFPDGALTKHIKVGLQVYPVQPELVSKAFGPQTAVSPIVTLEPRRRKFHKPINLTIPLPKKTPGNEKTTLRLLCSITSGSNAVQWEDITETTPPKIVNDVATFPTTVSARFWLVDTPSGARETIKNATGVYAECMVVPFMAKFVCFGRQGSEPEEGRLRVFCMTDDKFDKTLEGQQHFTEIARSKEIEVLDGKPQYIEMAGNLVPLTKSTEQLFINFHSFHENRLPITVRIKDPAAEPTGRIGFMKEPRGPVQQNPICTLTITLPGKVKEDVLSPSLTDEEFEDKLRSLRNAAKADDSISKTELRLTDIARELEGDWVLLAKQLGFTDEEIAKILRDHPGDPEEQALVMLHDWVDRNRPNATGNELEKALRKIARPDVIRKCMKNIEDVTDDDEKQLAKERLGIANGLSPHDEKDFTKASESADEDDAADRKVNDFQPQAVVDEKPISEDSVAPVHAERPRSDVDLDQLPDHPPVDDAPHKDKPHHKSILAPQSAASANLEEETAADALYTLPVGDEVRVLSEAIPELEAARRTAPVKTGAALSVTAPQSNEEESSPERDAEFLEADIESAEQLELNTTPLDVKKRTPVGVAVTVGSPDSADNEDTSTPLGDVETDKALVTVYTDTIEGKPETETQVEEFEETLPDGTTVKRRVTKTTEKQTLIKRIIVEGPEDELPRSSEEAEQLLRQLGADPEIAEYAAGAADDGAVEAPRVSTETEEFEETLPDGSTVKKKIIRTTEEQFHTERTVSDELPADLADEVAKRDGQLAGDHGEHQPGDEEDGEMETTRLKLRKQLRKRTVVNEDGREETILTEEIGVEQDTEAPEELQGCVQNIIDDFLASDKIVH